MSSQSAVHFACSSDRNYLDAMVATVTAVCRKLPTRVHPIFHFVDCGVPEDDAARALNCLSRHFPRLEIVTHSVAPARFAHWPDYSVAHIVKAVYTRLFFDEFLAGVPRCVYLDTDVVVDADISELYATPLDGHCVGAVLSDTRPQLKDYPAIAPHLPAGITATAPAFNAGVMLLDVERIRAEGAMERVRSIAGGLKGKCGDQALLNLGFPDRWIPIAKCWNRQVFLTPAFSIHRTAPNTLWHVIGGLKPWQVDRATAHGLVASFYDHLEYVGWTPDPRSTVRIRSPRWREFAKAGYATLARNLPVLRR